MIKYNPNNSFCKKCGLYLKVQSPCTQGRGNLNSKILIAGESNGQQEDLAGQPFVGKSGQMLNHYIEKLNLDCFICNVVSCRSVKIDSTGKATNKTPTPKEIECCRAHTMDLILEMKPKVIVTVGKVALNQLIKLNLNAEVARGKEFYFPEIDATILHTYHPAYILRTRDDLLLHQFERDLKLAQQIVARPPKIKINTAPISLQDPIDIKKYLINLGESPSFAFDLETTGLSFREDRITDISFCNELGKGVHMKWSNLLEQEKLFRDVLMSDNEKVAMNLSFDYKFLKQSGFEFKGTFFDIMLAYHTLTMAFEGGKARELYSLDAMSFFHTSEGGYKNILEGFGGIAGFQESRTKEVQGQLFNPDDYKAVGLSFEKEVEERLQYCSEYIKDIKKKRIGELKIKELAYYSAMDSDVTYRIYKYLKYKMDTEYKFPFYEIVMPLCLALSHMSMTGVKLDFEYMSKVAKQNREEILKIDEKFFNKIGYKINIDSSKDLRELIYGKLGILPDPNFLTKGGKGGNKQPSTDEKAIKHFASKKPVLKHIIEHRSLMKENSTYLEGFKKQVDQQTHRIHPDFLQLTATGRSSSPLHTVPKDNKIRNMVIAEKGCKLILIDLSQIELRMLAQLSNDQNMIKAFNSGHDFHAYTACTMFGIDLKSFDKKNPDHNKKRGEAKIINFGIIYGLVASSLARDLKISEQEAMDFMKKFFSSYPRILPWINETKTFAVQHGYIETLFERRRYLENVWSTNIVLKDAALRQATNTIIQSSSNDISSMAIIKMDRWLIENNKKSRLIGTVHDSILMESPEEEISEVTPKLVEFMTKDVPKMTIELKADVSILDKWIKD